MRHLSNSVRPIRSPADCEGIRIRTLTSPLHGETFRALGMTPEIADIAALLERSTAGTIDAQDNPLTNIFNFGIHELQPHITMTGHFWAPAVIVANKNAFQNWPGRVRAAVQTAAEASTRYQRDLALAEDARIMALLEPPVEVVTLSARRARRLRRRHPARGGRPPGRVRRGAGANRRRGVGGRAVSPGHAKSPGFRRIWAPVLAPEPRREPCILAHNGKVLKFHDL